MVAVSINSVITAFVKIVLKENISTSKIRSVEKIHAMQVLVEATYARMTREPWLVRVQMQTRYTMKRAVTASKIVR